MAPALTVLGLDPGSNATGYGLVAQDKAGRLSLVACGTIRPPAGDPLPARLRVIHQKLGEVIAAHDPKEAAVEGVFTAKNARSALILGHARGVALLALESSGLPVFEYPPAAVKKALVGVGRASKEQVRAMVGAILKATPPASLDASDALAVAIAHLNSRALKQKGLK